MLLSSGFISTTPDMSILVLLYWNVGRSPHVGIENEEKGIKLTMRIIPKWETVL